MGDGSTSTTITGTNGIQGLSQVLLAGDGTTQTATLFGLDLIQQDDGSATRTLLADGLGSVRTEMVDGNVETVTTYDPYGTLLAQTGTSSTAYGYTGEQHDAATGLLYLRARYYNPALRSFMARDAWRGNTQQPQSMNGWSYVENNPVNVVDPTGQIPEECKVPMQTKGEYVRCVGKALEVDLDHTALLRWEYLGTSGDLEFDEAMKEIKPTDTCFRGPIPYRASGYLEGLGAQIFDPSRNWPLVASGEEVVYDFATFERANFSYAGGYLTDSIGYSLTESVGLINGFRTWRDIRADYSDFFIVGSLGVSIGFQLPLLGGVSISAGKALFFGAPDPTVWGTSKWVAVSAALGDLAPLEPTGNILRYRMTNDPKPYASDGKVDVSSLVNDIIIGDGSPWIAATPVGLEWLLDVLDYILSADPASNVMGAAKRRVDTWEKLYVEIHKYADAYEEVHRP